MITSKVRRRQPPCQDSGSARCGCLQKKVEKRCSSRFDGDVFPKLLMETTVPTPDPKTSRHICLRIPWHVVTLVLLLSLVNLVHSSSSTDCNTTLSESFGVIRSPATANSNCYWNIAPNVSGSLNSTSWPGLEGNGLSFFVCSLTATLDFSDFSSLTTSGQFFIFEPSPNNTVQSLSSGIKQYTTFNTSFNDVWVHYQPPAGDEQPEFKIIYFVHQQVFCNDPDMPEHVDIVGDFSLGRTVVFQCPPGFQLHGANTSTCILTGCGNSDETDEIMTPRWSDDSPMCLRLQCPSPPTIANGNFDQSDSGWVVNATVTYSCNSPYVMSGSNQLTCRLREDGTIGWASIAPSCINPNCSQSQIISNSSVIQVNPPFFTTETSCEWWLINVREGMSISMNITYIDLPDGCTITVTDQSSREELFNSQNAIGNHTVESSGSSITVKFLCTSPGNSTHGGFYIKYMEVKPTEQTPGDSGSSSSNAGKIAAGVIVPLVVLAVGLGIGYWWYRKKYPVRMIMGRDFGKFSNPKYATPARRHTLVRDDAAEVFNSQIQPKDVQSVTIDVSGDGDGFKVNYVNTAFVYDSGEADEDEVEKRFRTSKSYLFSHSQQDDEEGKGIDNGAFEYEDVNDMDNDGNSTGKRIGAKRNYSGSNISASSFDSNRATVSEGSNDAPRDIEVTAAPTHAISQTREFKNKVGEYNANMTVKEYLQMVNMRKPRANSLNLSQTERFARPRSQSVEGIILSHNACVTENAGITQHRPLQQGSDEVHPAGDVLVTSDHEFNPAADVVTADGTSDVDYENSSSSIKQLRANSDTESDDSEDSEDEESSHNVLHPDKHATSEEYSIGDIDSSLKYNGGQMEGADDMRMTSLEENDWQPTTRPDAKDIPLEEHSDLSDSDSSSQGGSSINGNPSDTSSAQNISDDEFVMTAQATGTSARTQHTKTQGKDVANSEMDVTLQNSAKNDNTGEEESVTPKNTKETFDLSQAGDADHTLLSNGDVEDDHEVKLHSDDESNEPADVDMNLERQSLSSESSLEGEHATNKLEATQDWSATGLAHPKASIRQRNVSSSPESSEVGPTPPGTSPGNVGFQTKTVKFLPTQTPEWDSDGSLSDSQNPHSDSQENTPRVKIVPGVKISDSSSNHSSSDDSDDDEDDEGNIPARGKKSSHEGKTETSSTSVPKSSQGYYISSSSGEEDDHTDHQSRGTNPNQVQMNSPNMRPSGSANQMNDSDGKDLGSRDEHKHIDTVLSSTLSDQSDSDSSDSDDPSLSQYSTDSSDDRGQLRIRNVSLATAGTAGAHGSGEAGVLHLRPFEKRNGSTNEIVDDEVDV